jgi:hypothetical protein
VNKETDGCTVAQPEPAPAYTVGEVYDKRIENARKMVEQLCVKKAKLEALNMLHMPYRELSELLDTYPF